MKTIRKTQFLSLMAFFAVVLMRIAPAAAQPGMPISFRTFYEELAPYGQWVTHPSYGSIWVPDAGPAFQPYGTNGYWVMTEYGNTWVSDYQWGWAPFHYGRWFYDEYYGWAWVPGQEWGPAWVAWRSGGGYYGWAPLGPGVNIHVNIVIPANHWVFVPQRYITSPRPYGYCAPRHQVVNIYHNTVYVHNTYRSNNQVYVHGPHREEIGRVTRREVPVYRVEEASRPGRSVARNGAVEVYRPRVSPDAQGSSRPSRSEAYAVDRGSRSYEAPERSRPATGSVTPYENGRVGRSTPAQPASPRERAARTESYPESQSYPGEHARQRSVPEDRRAEYTTRPSRGAGSYGQQPESGRTRQQTQTEQPARSGQQRPQRAQSSARESSRQQESAPSGYSRSGRQ